MDGLDGLALYDNLRPFLQLFVLSTSRAFGVTLLFLAFAWGRLSSGVLRMSFAIALAFPIAVPFYGNAEVVLERLEAPFIIIVIKEMFLGALLGFLASIPFALVLSAGNIIDSYRGAFIGTPDPAGAPTTPYAQLFMIVALWIFAALGGFWIMTDVIYGTYAVWPLFTLLPELTGAGLSALVGLFRSMVVGALVVAGPILFLMMLSDFAFLVSARLGKQINVTHLAFSTKNIVALISLPLFAAIYVRVVTGDLESLSGIAMMLDGALR